MPLQIVLQLEVDPDLRGPIRNEGIVQDLNHKDSLIPRARNNRPSRRDIQSTDIVHVPKQTEHRLVLR